MSKSIVIGVDVGGTFTDIFALDEALFKITTAFTVYFLLFCRTKL